MGYRYAQRSEQAFFVPADQVPAMKAALAELVASDDAYYRQYAKGDQEPDHETVQDATGWHMRYDGDGNAVTLTLYSRREIYHEDFLDKIAPFVRPGSFVEMEGDDDDDIFRLVFVGDHIRKICPQIAWNMDIDALLNDERTAKE